MINIVGSCNSTSVPELEEIDRSWVVFQDHDPTRMMGKVTICTVSVTNDPMRYYLHNTCIY